MLELKDIRKVYPTVGEESVALDNINLTFGESEFVSILGTSGSGKTTLLNIIGGLDKYTSGDLLVDGTSTKNFNDRDWDSYRNGTIGFVFQSYNLISHLSILDNVKMALSLSGISEKESVKRSKQALHEVGLEKHLTKRPNQLSGGQMQRVAIARALVNNPKILLADEPTGALDSKTSAQIMELIKEISKNRLVIMVTHNPELANQYSNRIIEVSDGLVVKDTAPYNVEHEKLSGYKENKTSMSFITAIKSSLKNLLTKKTRTVMVTFAASIGIISVGLILAISSGMNSYIATMQEDVLANMPITISSSQPTQPVIKPPVENFGKEKELDESTLINKKESTEIHQNRYAEDYLEKGYTFIDYLEDNASDYYSNIIFTNGYNLKVLTKNEAGNIQEIKNRQNNTSLLSEIPEDKELVLKQYDIISSKEKDFKYPTKSNELVLIIGKDNSLSEETLTALGYDSDSQINFTDLLGKKLKIIDNNSYYQENADGSHFSVKPITEDMFNTGKEIEIVAIMKPKKSSTSLISSDIAYSKSLSDEMLNKESTSEIVSAQKRNKQINILSPSNESIESNMYTSVMQQLGGDVTPTKISVYPNTFDEREKVLDVVTDYNNLVEDKFGIDSDDYKLYSIRYSDMATTMTDSMTTLIDAVTLILVAFAGISLVVSSIMIGILTYVSVVERTKEIGIMRALGARKKDITRIFIAESTIIGLFAGLIGVSVAMLSTIPMNNVIENAIGTGGFDTNLSPLYAGLLILLSIILTFIAGYIPSKMAARKNPVEALRTE